MFTEPGLIHLKIERLDCSAKRLIVDHAGGMHQRLNHLLGGPGLHGSPAGIMQANQTALGHYLTQFHPGDPFGGILARSTGSATLDYHHTDCLAIVLLQEAQAGSTKIMRELLQNGPEA